MWAILSILKQCTTQKLIKDAVKNRGIENVENNEDLIKNAPEFYDNLIAVYV